MKRACLLLVLVSACSGGSPPSQPAPSQQPAPTPVAPDVTLPDASALMPASLNPGLPALHIRITGDERYSTRTTGEWTPHTTDAGVLDAMQANAGEVDLDSGRSDLQVVLRFDRAVKWQAFLGILEMMRMVGCERLLVETGKGLIALPLARTLTEGATRVTLEPGPHGFKASLQIAGERYSDDAEHVLALGQWVKNHQSIGGAVAISLPAVAPFQTLFHVLDAISPLQPESFAFGG